MSLSISVHFLGLCFSLVELGFELSVAFGCISKQISIGNIISSIMHGTLLSTRRLMMCTFCIWDFQLTIAMNCSFYKLRRTGKDFGGQALFALMPRCLGLLRHPFVLPVYKSADKGRFLFVCLFTESLSIYKIIAFKDILYIWKCICFLRGVKGHLAASSVSNALQPGVRFESVLVLLCFMSRLHQGCSCSPWCGSCLSILLIFKRTVIQWPTIPRWVIIVNISCWGYYQH